MESLKTSLKTLMKQESNMNIGGNYNFKRQAEKLVYLGYYFSGNGRWHQFAKVDDPEKIWAEISESDIHLIEKTT